MTNAPDTFRVERSIDIDAPPERIAPALVNFRRWTERSPWDKAYPEMERTYSSAAEGVGAVYERSGKKAGAGRMEIKRVTIQLDFTRPFKASNTAEFTLAAAGSGARVAA